MKYTPRNPPSLSLSPLEFNCCAPGSVGKHFTATIRPNLWSVFNRKNLTIDARRRLAHIHFYIAINTFPTWRANAHIFVGQIQTGCPVLARFIGASFGERLAMFSAETFYAHASVVGSSFFASCPVEARVQITRFYLRFAIGTSVSRFTRARVVPRASVRTSGAVEARFVMSTEVQV